MKSGRINNRVLKYKWFPTHGRKDPGIRNLEFVVRTQFLFPFYL